MSLLPAEPLDLGHGHPLDAMALSASFTSSSLNGLDDRFYLLHGISPFIISVLTARRKALNLEL